ncbi:MAG: S8 family peptidase [Euzebyales bacterium]|nr:S8 family peptidase [Euzebyales bacterium]
MERTGHLAIGLMLAALLLTLAPAALAADRQPERPPSLAEPGPRGTADPRAQAAAPAAVVGADDPDAIEGQYIVVLRKDLTARSARAVEALAEARGGRVGHTYSTALDGFSAKLPAQAVDALTRNPNVAYVEADRTVAIADTQSPATWGLDRIDQRDRPLDNSYTYDTTGSGVNAYVIDTGIRRSHNEFGGRAVHGYTAINDGRGSDDCNGHGTHVAGTVGGTTYGVAKASRLVAVRVLACNGSGSTSGVIAGVDWVTSNHVKPAVANMSLGGGASSSLDSAVSNSIAAGVTYAVAAGNSNANACNYSPARVGQALTVGSTTSSDARSSFSNFGTCLDIFAPGSSITSAWHTSNTATNTISGTSMAAPHVAGVAALYLQSNSAASPATVGDAIVSGATSGRLSGVGSGSPNLLLYSLLTSGEPDPDPDPDPEPACSYAESYPGSLGSSGDYDYAPNGDYFYSGSSGYHRGCLIGPDGTDFDLYLWKWNGWNWRTVARGISPSSVEDVSYYGSAGYYVWRIESYRGSGSYAFSMDRP